MRRAARRSTSVIAVAAYLLLSGGAWQWYAHGHPPIDCPDTMLWREWVSCHDRESNRRAALFFFTVLSPFTVPVVLGAHLFDEAAPTPTPAQPPTRESP